jgi:putative transposase
MRAHQASYPVATMCRVLEVSKSGYHAWLKRAPCTRAQRDAELTTEIRAIHAESDGTYGRPRIHAELKEQGEKVGSKRIARLMKENGLHGASRRRDVFTTRRDRDARPAPDLVDRDFTADGPDQLWVADITYIPTWSGFLFLAVVLDAWSRGIVGWAMATHLRTELVLDALNMAVQQRKPAAVIHHSDQGCQYTSIAFGLRCRVWNVRPLMGSVGDCFDNAMCESFFATLECELREHRNGRKPSRSRRSRSQNALGFDDAVRWDNGVIADASSLLGNSGFSNAPAINSLGQIVGFDSHTGAVRQLSNGQSHNPLDSVPRYGV